jgi:hypothetical protein
MKLVGKWLSDVFQKDSFSGNGVTVTFTLTQTPHSEEAIEVYLDGLLESDYTVNLGTPSVTLTTAPANGQDIEVNYFKK